MIGPTDCILVMGRRGCGKSYLAKNIQKVFDRRVIIDSLDEYTDGDQVRSFDGFCAKLAEYKNTDQKNFVLIFKFDPEEEVSAELFNEILRVCYHFQNIQIVIEEVQLYSTPHNLPHWLRQCLLTGRHKDLSLLFTSQRPGEINKTIVSQCSHIFCGQIIEGNDLRYVSSFLNQSADRLVSLPKRRFLYFSEGTVHEISNDY